jgi:cytidine deaminase
MSDPNVSSAPAVEPDLVAAANAVRANAHVPYSGFKVGAAVRAWARDRTVPAE